MKVRELFIYPVKSCAGIFIHTGTVDARGFEHDRRFMIVDAYHRFVTQRTHPRLALLKTTLQGDTLRVAAPDQSHIILPLRPKKGSPVSVTVWSDRVTALDVSPEANRWLSEFLENTCKLVYLPDMSIRPLKNVYRKNDEHISFADAFPFLLTSQVSLDELNRRLLQPVPMNRFRPNIVVDGILPFAEDEWKDVQIGEVRLRAARACARCSTTTVDQTTGVRGTEPLATLGTFRRRGKEVFFGINLIHKNNGSIAVGDEVVIFPENDFSHS